MKASGKALYLPNLSAFALPLDIEGGTMGKCSGHSDDAERRFFGSGRAPHSKVKSQIVTRTFLGWAGVMLNLNPVALWYLDLYCGRGRYRDGSPSTPIELFEKVSSDVRLRNVVRMVFNDKKADVVFELRDHLMAHPLFAALRWPPHFTYGEVNEAMVAQLKAQRPKPFTFAFLDPFGYKGLSQELLYTILRDYGCDVLFYFGYHPIKRVLNNPNDKMRAHVESLLGPSRVKNLQMLVRDDADERTVERAVLAALGASMKEIDGRGVLTFAFRRATGRASHHLAFVSKSARGYQVAKEAMGFCSSWRYRENIPSFEYLTAGYDHQLELNVDAPSIEQLMRLLVKNAGGRKVTVQSAYDAVMYDNPYIESNVRQALVRLVCEHNAPLFSDGRPATLRGTRLPNRAVVTLPVRVC